MRKDKKLAIKLRRAGKSYNQISKTLTIQKGTLSGWFKNDPVSQKVKTALNDNSNPLVARRIKNFVENNRKRWLKWRSDARQEAENEFAELSKKPLFVAGLMLYWGEGDSKMGNPLRFTNTDPRMISLYVKFVRKVLEIPKKKLKITLVLYPDLLENTCKNFWSKITNLSKQQFYKTQFIKGRHPTKRLSNGICMITAGGGRRMKEKFAVWIDLLSKKL